MTDDLVIAHITHDVLVFGIAVCGIWIAHKVLKTIWGNARGPSEHERAYYEHKHVQSVAKAVPSVVAAPVVNPSIELAVAALSQFGYSKQAARDALARVPAGSPEEMITAVMRGG